jgi:hypothetical protein
MLPICIRVACAIAATVLFLFIWYRITKHQIRQEENKKAVDFEGYEMLSHHEGHWD